ncbi:DUF2878 domain-containing protein [Endozoicomonas sp. OPT23]|uniref:DUF2878 domain-containing protein n=1 Tax=Endozoicomonas sp. OPT23 TaxID=2072845 RepID=UPI00129BFD54|nr:DUF2878 domain-containing protein [Endozoicomonas sp. OPT23]MRI31846.1 DUF2878 domain-containing protein [Endozoicomonas sp. OPT23]
MTLNREMVFNGVWFYLTWLSAVWGQTAFLPLTAALLLLHGFIHRKHPTEFLLILIVASIGIEIDQLLSWSGFFIFKDSIWLPEWLLLLWCAFAATLRHSLNFLAGSPKLAAVFGAIGGSSSYFAGVQLGAVEFGFSLIFSLTVLAFIWAVLMPLFFQINHWLSRKFA